LSSNDRRHENEMRCRYCGAGLIFDPETYAYVCPNCGIVYGYEMLPSYAQLKHVTVLDSKSEYKLDREVIERAREIFGETVAKELSRLDKRYAKEVLTALESIINKSTYRVSWNVLRKALEIAEKYNMDTDLEEIREKRIREEIEKFVKEECPEVDPNEVWYFTIKYKKLWAGRKSSTVAKIFTYIYCKKKLNKEIKLDSRTLRVARTLEKVMDYELR